MVQRAGVRLSDRAEHRLGQWDARVQLSGHYNSLPTSLHRMKRELARFNWLSLALLWRLKNSGGAKWKHHVQLKISSQKPSNPTQPLYHPLAISLWLLERWRSLMCQVTGQGKWGNFIAQWVPTWLIIGLYNKLVKLEGHDRYQRGRHDDWERIAAKEANAGLSA
jgi:hypothetical protein